MRGHAVQTDSGDLGALRDGARHGRAAAMSRRRALAAGRSAPAPAAAGDATRPAAPNGRGTPGGAQGAPEATAVAINSVAAARLGRALSMQRRRQLSQGKQALNGGDRTADAADAGAPTFVVLRGGGR